MTEWMFTAEELSLVMGDAELEPWLGSPFLRMAPVSDDSGTAIAPETTPEMIEAIRRIARPESVLGLVVYPPDDPATSWFYGDDAGYALFHETEDGCRVVWPLDELELLDVVIEPLDLPTPTSGFEFSLAMDRSGFEALAAVVDMAQENGLLGFLHRDDPPELSFDTSDLLACWERGMASANLEWMIHRAGALSPVALAPSGEGLARGVQALAEQEALVADNGLWRATPVFAMFCSMLGACNGLAALSTRTRSPEDGAWRLEHLAATRCTEGIWLFDFADISSTDFSLTLRDIPAGELYERLCGAVPAGERTREPEEPPPPESVSAPAEERSCPGCGALLKPDASFCSGCGAPVQQTGQASPAAFCTGCGQQLEPDASFCSGCGAPAQRTKQASPAAYCTACGQQLKPDADFCVACGGRAKGVTGSG